MRRLVKMNRLNEAREVFGAVYDVPPESDTVTSQIRDIQVSIEISQSSALTAMFKMGPQRTVR